MPSPTSSFNPAQLAGQIPESSYPVEGWSEKGTELNREREDVIEWLRKKFQDDQPSLALADKLEGCKRNHRCKSPACPECAYAAEQWLTSVIEKYLVNKAKEAA